MGLTTLMGAVILIAAFHVFGGSAAVAPRLALWFSIAALFLTALPIQASATAAIYVADSFFFTIQGIAYDKTGRLGDLLMTEPLKRPSEWQAAMPAILKTHGYPRHLYGNYWKVTMSMD